MKLPIPALALVLVCVILPAPSRAAAASAGKRTRGEAAPEITTPSLLHELIDLEGLSRFPDPPFTCRQFSSYDRKSKSPREDWFANADCGQFLREEKVGERTEYVMVDAQGPGAIVRIWSANPKGTLRIYLDKAAAPVVEEKMTDFLSGKTAGFPFPIAHTVSRGWNAYFPIAYAEHCKITSDEPGFYYQVNYRTYAPGTRVRTFTAEDPEKWSEAVEAVVKGLSRPEELPRPGKEVEEQGHALVLPPKAEWKTRLSADSEGSAVCGLECAVSAENRAAALRGLLLEMDFDGFHTVSAPLGDFFGTAPGANPYASLPLEVKKDGTLVSRWWMPYRKEATLRLENLSKEKAEIRLKVRTVPAPFREETLYFHAKWRQERGIPTRPMRDWTFMTAEGKGVFVGDALYVANPVKNWWGEGDEKIYVDGEPFPSHFGTGTEDYYGYAWCCPELFTHAYHNQTRCDGPGNYGHTAVNRWHVADRIPFTRSFRFDMEVWHWKEVKIDYAVLCCWYATGSSTDDFPSPAADPENRVLHLLPPYQPHKVKGALEGESLEVLEKTGGNAVRQDTGETYSGEAQLWWRDAKPGDRLVLAFESPSAGRRRLYAVFTKAPDYGIHRLAVNGEPVKETFDLYKKGPWGPTKEIDLGAFDLAKGRNTLTVTIEGANPEAKPAYMFGLDYLRIE